MENEKKLLPLEVKLFSTNQSELFELKDQEMNVINTLCKAPVAWGEYKVGLVPDKVETQVTAVEDIFWEIEVYESGVDHDPFAVGVLPTTVYPTKTVGGFVTKSMIHEDMSIEEAKKMITEGCPRNAFSYLSNNPKRYLIAQWGRELKSLAELAKLAKSKWLLENKQRYTEQRLEAEKNLAMLELDAEVKFG